MSKTYYDIALDEYKYLNYKLDIDSGINNPSAALCQQVAEKMLKHVLTEVEPSAQELKIHNLKKINIALKRNSIDLYLNSSDLAYLTDFYFEARYPGDDYIDVTNEDLRECIKIMEDIKAKVESYLRDRKDTKLDNNVILDRAFKNMSGH